MKKLNMGSDDFTQVMVLDDPSHGGAYHEYEVCSSDEQDDNEVFASIGFQNGPIKEKGVNGCHHEDLLVIVMHRLVCFQAGDWKCHENAMAITKLQEALHWLRHRTNERKRRNIEGISTV